MNQHSPLEYPKRSSFQLFSQERFDVTISLEISKPFPLVDSKMGCQYLYLVQQNEVSAPKHGLENCIVTTAYEKDDFLNPPNCVATTVTNKPS